MAHKDLAETRDVIRHLGYDLTPAGLFASEISLSSDYTIVETSSHLVAASLAWDAMDLLQQFDVERSFLLAQHGLEALKILRGYAERRLMSERIWKNDAKAIMELSQFSEATEQYVKLVLSDPVVGAGRTGISRILTS